MIAVSLQCNHSPTSLIIEQSSISATVAAALYALLLLLYWMQAADRCCPLLKSLEKILFRNWTCCCGRAFSPSGDLDFFGAPQPASQQGRISSSSLREICCRSLIQVKYRGRIVYLLQLLANKLFCIIIICNWKRGLSSGRSAYCGRLNPRTGTRTLLMLLPPPRTTRLGRPENKIALLFAAYIFFVARRTNQDGRSAGWPAIPFYFSVIILWSGTRSSQRRGDDFAGHCFNPSVCVAFECVSLLSAVPAHSLGLLLHYEAHSAGAAEAASM